MGFNYLSPGYTAEYDIDKFKIKETRLKNTKGEYDNYYFEIINGEETFKIQTFKKITANERVIKDIKYYEDDSYKCILPITKKDDIFVDIMCKDNNDIYYYYNSIAGKDSLLDEFAENFKKYRISFEKNDVVLKDDGITTTYSNISDNLYIGIEYYKGLYILNDDKGFIKEKLFKKDIYTKDITAFVKNYYLTADYDEEYEFHEFKLVDLKTRVKDKIISDKAISMYSYVQGVVGSSVYIIDTTNKKQYEVDVKTKTVIIVGDEENGIKIYKNGKWEKGNIYDAINSKLLFDDSTTRYNDKEYARVDKIGKTKSGYYYLYEFVNDGYNVYKVNIQDDNLIYLFKTSSIDRIIYNDDYIFYQDGNFIKIYHDLEGTKKIARYDEISFNKSLKIGIYR